MMKKNVVSEPAVGAGFNGAEEENASVCSIQSRLWQSKVDRVAKRTTKVRTTPKVSLLRLCTSCGRKRDSSSS